MLISVFNRISATNAGAGNVCVSGVVDALPQRYEGHEDLPSCKVLLNSKRSLPVLKWASESFEFQNFFLQTL